jgi:hypothetical protein
MKKLVLATIGAFAAAILAGCENPGWNQWDSVSLQNNSDHTIILRRYLGGPGHYEGTPRPIVTAPPLERGRRADILPTGLCFAEWDIVDTSGKQLRTIDEVCAGQTVVYP